MPTLAPGTRRRRRRRRRRLYAPPAVPARAHVLSHAPEPAPATADDVAAGPANGAPRPPSPAAARSRRAANRRPGGGGGGERAG